MNLPDTYAAGVFSLPLKVAKIARLAAKNESSGEREAAIRKLWELGYFFDRAGIIWKRGEVPEIAKDELYKELDGEAA